jgi:hypothetical protein
MKELVNLGSRFIGFRDEAETLRGNCPVLVIFICFYLVFVPSFLSVLPEVLSHAEERADDLEAKLKVSEEARKKAEKDAACVEDLRRRLQAAEDALSDKEAKQI